jgi:hypothetical protein
MVDDAGKVGFRLEDINLDAIASLEDKLEECRYFLELVDTASKWDHFRWLTSAFLGAAYSFFEISALRAHLRYSDRDIGELSKCDETLGVLGQYVKVTRGRKRDRVSTSAVHPIVKVLYDLRHENTHRSPLALNLSTVTQPERFQFVRFDGLGDSGRPVLSFFREVMALMEVVNKELEGVR